MLVVAILQGLGTSCKSDRGRALAFRWRSARDSKLGWHDVGISVNKKASLKMKFKPALSGVEAAGSKELALARAIKRTVFRC